MTNGTFEEITNTPIIVTCIVLLYVAHLIIFLFTDNPYSTSASKYSFDFLMNFVIFWGAPILLGAMLANSIAAYYTGTYGKLAPLSVGKITHKEMTSSNKGRRSYYFHLSNNLLSTLSVSKEGYEKAIIGQCVEVQYRTSSLGIYRDYWKFTTCPDEFSPHLYQQSFNHIKPLLSETAVTKEQRSPYDILQQQQKKPANEILERYIPTDKRQ